MTQPDFRNPQFWITLRKRTSLDGRVGFEECSLWCDEALNILRDYRVHGFRKIENSVSLRVIAKYGLVIDAHRFLVRNYAEGIFIADGTAGQVDKNYPLGFYNWRDCASERLSLFYK